MAEISSTFYIVLVGYFTVVLGIGFWTGRGNKTSEDHLLAGRSIGPVIGGAALAATQMSAGTFVGTMGVHWLTGASFAWFWSGLWLGWVVSAVFVAPKFQKFKALTVADYVEKRYNSKAAKAVAAVLILIALSVYLIGQYVAGGILLQTVFGIPKEYGCALTILVTLVYTMKGGMKASTYSDFIQAIIMAGCFFAAIPILLMQGGGLVHVGTFLTELDPRITGWYYGAKDLIGFGAAFGFSMAVAPYELARMYTLRNPRTVRLAIGFSFVFQAIVGLSVCMGGMAMRALYPVLSTGDMASSLMSASVLPPFIGALFVVAILSAIMSTVSGVLIVSSASVSHDLYGLINPAATDAAKMRLNKITTLVLACIPFYFALNPFDMVQFIVMLQSSLVSSFFFAIVAIGLNWKGATRSGAIASMLAGILTVLVWYLLGKPYGMNEVIPGVIISGLTLFIVSNFTEKVPDESLAPFFPEIKMKLGRK